MRNKLPVIIAYVSLIVLSLPVPLLHYYRTDRAIEAMRPHFIRADGVYVPMLMPADILMLRWLGQLSWWVPFGVAAMFLLSFRREALARFDAICAIAICQCAFTTFYALYAALLLGFYWQQPKISGAGRHPSGIGLMAAFRMSFLNRAFPVCRPSGGRRNRPCPP